MKKTLKFLIIASLGLSLNLNADTCAVDSSEPCATCAVDMEELESLEKKAAKGDDKAQYKLGSFYQTQSDDDDSLAKAATLYREAADQGNVKAQHALALCYLEGIGVKINEEDALFWLQAAASLGDCESMLMAGYFYDNGIGTRQDMTIAISFYKQAAKLNYAPAQHALAISYERGEGLDAPDSTKAIEYYKLAAAQDYAPAIYNLAYSYANGEGVKKDLKEAAKLYEKAALLGDVDAQIEIGGCYEKGLGVEKNDEKAQYWFKKAMGE